MYYFKELIAGTSVACYNCDMTNYQALIFDLDGTLWETKNSYLFAYNQIKKEYSDLKIIHDDEYILATMGYKLLEVMELVFGAEESEKKELLIKKALKYSCDYLLKNSSTIYQGVAETLLKLKEKYPLFLVSNCPKEYLEVFFKISNLKDIFTDYYYLDENGNSIDKIIKIINKYNYQKVLFISDFSEDIPAFLPKVDFAYASYGYKKCSNYHYLLKEFKDLLPLLTRLDYRNKILSSCSNYFVFKENDAEVALIINNSHDKEEFFFGFWNYSEDEINNHKVFQKLEGQVKLLNGKNLVGPIDATTWYNYRLALDNFDWMLYPDIKNSSREVEFLKSRKYQVAYTYLSTLTTINENLWGIASKVQLNNSFRVQVVNGEDSYKYLKDIYNVVIDSFKTADFYSPISYEDFQDIYLLSLKQVNPDLILIYYQEEVVGFSFCYEDPLKRFYVSKTIAIKDNYQNGKIILKLIDYSYQLMAKKQYQTVLCHFQNEHHPTLRKTWQKIIRQKKYGLFSLEVENEN